MEVLKINDLSIHFGGLKAVSDFNITINKNEIVGLIGPNGAGKTTIFNLITGVYKPTNGKIFFCYDDITNVDQMHICRKGIARTFQNIRLFYNMSVIDNVMVGMSSLKENHCSIPSSIFRTKRHFNSERDMREEAKKLLKVFNLLEERNEVSSSLPYGKQRKLEIARALATRPTLLLLDEPAAGMNEEETKELMETIKSIRDAFDLTILIIEHDMKLISNICDKVTVLNFGQVLASGTAKEVLNNSEVIKAYLGD